MKKNPLNHVLDRFAKATEKPEPKRKTKKKAPRKSRKG